MCRKCGESEAKNSFLRVDLWLHCFEIVKLPQLGKTIRAAIFAAFAKLSRQQWRGRLLDSVGLLKQWKQWTTVSLPLPEKQTVP